MQEQEQGQSISLKQEVKDGLLIITVVAFLGLAVMTSSYGSAADAIDSAAAVAAAPQGDTLYRQLHWEMVTPHAPWGKRDSHFAYIFNNKLYMAAGLDADDTFVGGKPVYEKAIYYHDIWVTEDGTNWKLVTDHSSLPLIRSMSVVNFKGKLIGVGGWGPEIGENKNIYESDDGINWHVLASDLPFPPREGMRALVANDKIYFFGGVNYDIRKTYNDVWASDDAVHWSELTDHAPWSPRWDDDVIYYKGNFWLVGGMNLSMDGFDDVWYSPDGASWHLALKQGPFDERQGVVLVDYRGAMYLVGGLEARSNLGKNKVWFSTDGFKWTKIDEDTLWPPREDQEVIVFKDKILMFGGMSTNWHWTNDFWIASLPTYN